MMKMKKGLLLFFLIVCVLTLFTGIQTFADPTPTPEAPQTEAPTPSPTPLPTPPPEAVKAYSGIAKGKNVIIIQWESLQNLPVNRKLNGVEITPNLNKLIKESVYFKNGISQIAKGTTSDAEFTVATSCYPLKNFASFKTLYDRKMIGMPYLFNQEGYNTATFHTNTATFWNRETMYPALGWSKWYDREFFGRDFTVTFGAADYVLYTKAMPELLKMKKSGKPFLTQFITVSSHNPYTVPYWMKTAHFSTSVDYTFTGKYLRTINYSDRQLGMFMDALKKNDLYDDSLIVVYGDHFGLGEDKLKRYGLTQNLNIIKTILGRNYDKFDLLNIPILFKLPGGEGAQVMNMPAGQIDIMPTILNLAGIENPDGRMFGNDLLNITENQVGVRFYAPDGSYGNNTQFFVGEDYSITYTHKTAKIEEITPEMEAINAKMAESDEYLMKLKRIKKQ